MGLSTAQQGPAGTPWHEQPVCHGHHRQTAGWWQQEADKLLGRLVKPYLQAWDSPKPGDQAASSMDQNENSWCFFTTHPSLPVDQSACPSSPLNPIKTPDFTGLGQMSG